MKRKLSLIGLSISLFFSAMVTTYAKPIQLIYDGKTHSYDLPAITLYINNEKVKTEVMDPIQIDDRVLVPVREVFEPMGAGVEWNQKEQKVWVTYKDSLLTLKVNQKSASLNDKNLTLDVPAKIINDKLMVPVRFISEAMGFDVKWVQSTRSVYVSEQVEVPPATTDPEPEVPVTPPVNPEPEVPVTPPVDPEPEVPVVPPVSTEPNTYIGLPNYPLSYIMAQSADKTNITGTTITDLGEESIVLIKASSAITGANVQLQQGKVVVDIENSTNKLSTSSTPSQNNYVKTIRTSQFTPSAARVVLDLKSGAVTEASLTSDRQAIQIKLKPQNIEEIKAGRNSSKGDFIYLKGVFASQLIVDQDKNSNVISFKVNNAKIYDSINWSNEIGEHINRVTVENVGTAISGKLYMNKDINYTVTSDEIGTTIYFSKPTYQNISYSAGSRPTFIINKTYTGMSSSVTVNDLYREKKLVINLGSDYSHQVGYGTMLINDSRIKTVDIATSGTTTLTINTQSVYAYNINETDTTIEIELLKPNEKYDKIVVLDAGHGGSDNGASGNGLKEKVVNLNHTLAVYKLLQQDPNIKVYMTRETDEYPSLQYRTELANDIGADLFVSIHNNSASSGVKGTETLYYPSDSDTKSKDFASIVQNKIIANCNMTNRGIKSRPDLYVLRTSKMPAILIEGGFLTNAQDASVINSTTFINNYAKAVYNGIVEMFSRL